MTLFPSIFLTLLNFYIYSFLFGDPMSKANNQMPPLASRSPLLKRKLYEVERRPLLPIFFSFFVSVPSALYFGCRHHGQIELLFKHVPLSSRLVALSQLVGGETWKVSFPLLFLRFLDSLFPFFPFPRGFRPP